MVSGSGALSGAMAGASMGSMTGPDTITPPTAQYSATTTGIRSQTIVILG